MENNQTRLSRLFEESKKEVLDVGIDLKNDIDIKISYNVKGRLGCCKGKKHIEISEYMFKFSDDEIKNTIIHEILHTLDDTSGHNVKWKYYASIINKNYKQYNITRLGNVRELCENNGLQMENVIPYKYKIVCDNCDKIFYRNRLSNYQKSYVKYSYKCTSCGSGVHLYER